MNVKVETAIITEVKKALNHSANLMNTSNERFDNQIESQQTCMNEFLQEYEEKQKSFFMMNGIRNIIFWFGTVSNVLILGLLVFFIFFK